MGQQNPGDSRRENSRFDDQLVGGGLHEDGVGGQGPGGGRKELQPGLRGGILDNRSQSIISCDQRACQEDRCCELT